MKKAFALLLALALVGGAVFAEDVAYTLSGSATLTWGYDLNTENHGFTNEAEALLEVTFVTEASDSKGETPITGYIMIEEFSMVYDTDDGLAGAAGDVTAKILFPNDLYMTIYSAPGFGVGNAEQQAVQSDDDGDYRNFVDPSIDSSGGFTLGMDGVLSFALNIGSTNTHDATAADATDAEYGWIDDDDDPTTPDVWGEVTEAGDAGADPANDYMIGIDLGYAVGDLATVGVNFIYGSFSADLPMVGLGVSVDATPMDGLAVYLGADIQMYDEITGMDLQFDASYEIADLLSFSTGAYLGMTDFENPLELNPYLSALVRVSLLAVENLTLSLGVDLWDILDVDKDESDLMTLIGVEAAYEVALDGDNYVKPYANVYSASDEVLVLDLGVELGLIPLTTIDINFSAGSLADNLLWTGTSYGSDAGQDKGVFTIAVTVAY